MGVKPFYFKQFVIHQDQCAMKIGTDGVLIGAWADVRHAGNALDIGTGTGLIAIMLAQRSEHLKQIDAVEIDTAAFRQAVQNVDNCTWKDKIQVYQQSIQDFSIGTPTKYDLIVSNPPYFNNGTQPAKNKRNQARHTAELNHTTLLLTVEKLLKPTGKFCLILPTHEGLELIKEARKYHLYCSLLVKVHPKKHKPIERLLIQLEKTEKPLKEQILTLQFDKRNHFTPEYSALTREFYTIL